MRSCIRASVGRLRDQPQGGRLLSDPATGEPRPDPEDSAEAVHLDAGEELIVAVRGIGATMLLTTTRLIVARDGFKRRPRSGVQSFALSRIEWVAIELGTGTSGRIVVWSAPLEEAVSMFFEPRSLDRAEAFVAEARLRIARHRRGLADPGARDVRGIHR